MKILFAASEATPFIKTGGLADVAGSLPQALAAQGADVRVVMPKFYQIPEEYKMQMEHLCEGFIPVAWRQKFIGIDKLVKDGVTFYFIDNEEYFHRMSYYGYPDDAERFSFFCRGALEIMEAEDFWPDVIHANDWHCALLPVLLRLEHMGDERYQKIKTLFTIHNLKYQGIFDKEIMHDVLGLDWKYFNNGDLEFFDAVNFMKGGIVYADKVSTVSRTYAEEIQYDFYGEKLDGLLRTRKADLSGIVNGIDYDLYNPATDKDIYENFDVNSIYKKLDNKEKLQAELGLPVDREIPVVAVVSRLVEAKGLDLVTRILDELLTHERLQFVLLGTGDRDYEEWFRGLAWRHPTKAAVHIGFSNQLAQRIYAGATIFLMPSVYEPCGLSQIISMRYGTIPVVRETGGLKDTVTPFDKYSGKGNGYSFPNFNAHELMFTIKRALGDAEHLETWQQVVKNAMETDFSWKQAAGEYMALYEELGR